MLVHIFGPLSITLSKEGGLPDKTLFVDAGIQHIESIPQEALSAPKALMWIGDFDGLEKARHDKYREAFLAIPGPKDKKEVLKYPRDKNESDLALAFQSLVGEAEESTIHLYGFLGGELDHQLAVLGEAHQFLKENPDSSLTFFDQQGKEKIRAANGKLSLNQVGPLSLLSLEQQTMGLKGELAYGGDLLFKPLSSLGLANKAQGPFTVTSEKPFFLIWQ